MNTNASILLRIGKICTVIALIGFLLLIISSLALEDAGLIVFFILSAFSAVAALVSNVALLVNGSERTGLLTVMLISNILLVICYACIILYFCFIVPAAVTETMNGG